MRCQFSASASRLANAIWATMARSGGLSGSGQMIACSSSFEQGSAQTREFGSRGWWIEPHSQHQLSVRSPVTGHQELTDKGTGSFELL